MQTYLQIKKKNTGIPQAEYWGGYFILKPLVKNHAKTVIKSQIEMGIVGLPSTMPFK